MEGVCLDCSRDGNVAHSMLDLVSSSDINLALSRRVTTQFDNWEALCRKLMGEKEDIERRQKLLMVRVD